MQAGEEYHVTAEYVHSYDYVLPPALKLYQYDAEGRLVRWEYLRRRLGGARSAVAIDEKFVAAEGATSAKIVLCTRGIGTIWVTPFQISRAE